MQRCARRSAKQKKAVPAKNSEANFWRPRFTWPLRAGKRANANFACSEGFFCARSAAPFARAGRSCAAGRCCGGFCTRCLFALRAALYARFSFVFCLFLFGCCLSNLFSFVAHAATGISLLVPSHGFVPGPRVLSPAAFSRAFAPIACFSVLCCSHGFPLLFFHLFLPNFFLSNLFSFVAQAATGLYFLPKRK